MCATAYLAAKDRGITSSGGGFVRGMFVDRCQFLVRRRRAGRAGPDHDCDQTAMPMTVKIRDNRATRFSHFALPAGQNNIVTREPFLSGDTVKKRASALLG